MYTQKRIGLLLSIALLCGAHAVAQSAAVRDTINRNVTVEREFQPVIQDAGKINAKPTVVEPVLEPYKIQYVKYDRLLETDFDINVLPYADTKFNNKQNETNGLLRGGLGHPMSMLDFYYQMTEKRDVAFDVHANHLGQWGSRLFTRQGGGFDVKYNFGNSQFFVGFDAKNTAFRRYYTGSQWDFDAHVGIRSQAGRSLRYLVQTGYRGLATKGSNWKDSLVLDPDVANAVEHEVRTLAQIGWTSDGGHSLGANMALENHLFSTADSLTPSAFHVLKAEPYYSYAGTRFSAHIGVNLDFSFGNGRTFAPSPNIYLEGRIVPEWLAIYAAATGEYSTRSLRSELSRNPYLNIRSRLADSVNTYIPICATLGLKLRPQKNLLIKVWADYTHIKDGIVWLADVHSHQFSYVRTNNERWRIRGAIDYHYRDIVSVNLDGGYSFGPANAQLDAFNVGTNGDDLRSRVYNSPFWDIHLSVRAKVAKKWTIFSENHFLSKTNSLVMVDPYAPLQAVLLPTTIDVNLGVEYTVNKWLTAFLRVNNLLDWNTDKFNHYAPYYGYEAQGVNFLVGICWRF